MNAGSAVPAADEAFLQSRQEEDVQLYRFGPWSDPDHHAGAALAHRGIGLFDRLLVSDGLEPVVRSTPLRQLPDRRDRVFSRGIDDVRGPEHTGQFELARVD